jgi:hypothetical protein
MEFHTKATVKTCLTNGVLAVFLFFLMFSCSQLSDSNKIKVPDELEDYYEFQGFDLSHYGIPATIMLPDETANIGASTTPEVLHLESDFYWNIHVGQNFHLYIEDYGDNTNLVKDQKEKLANTQFYDVEYLVNEKDIIVYKVTLKVRGHANASKSVGVKHESYHVYSEKVINGIHYELRSRDEGFDKDIIDLMAKSIQSFKEKKK